MILRLMLALLVLGLSPLAVQAAPFRIASVGPQSPCRGFPDREKALADLLSRRIGQTVVQCPFASRADAAKALAGGQVDMALLTPESYAGHTGKVRAILTLHLKDDPGRLPVVVAAMATDRRTGLGDFKGGSAVFASRAPYDLMAPRRALADQGVGSGYFREEGTAGNADAAAAQLRAGKAELLVLNGDAWQRICRGIKPDDRPCMDLKVIWKGRPQAGQAWAVSTSLPPQLRYRLIGIYLAMHLESPEAFRVASGFEPRAALFDAAEAEALSPARNAR
jgi:ABC-type phosphate/phosphonate transport system substrate-binding protein